MKINEILQEKIMDPDEFGYELSARTIINVVKRVTASMYPDTTIKTRPDPETGYVEFTITDINPTWHTGFKKEMHKQTNFTVGVSGAESEISVNFAVDVRSSHKGLVTTVIDQLFKSAERSWGKSQGRNISVQNDAGAGVWQYIANKLGATFGAEQTK